LGLENKKFECETCVRAKSHCVTYPINLKKNFVPFNLVHTDVWSLSLVISKSGSKWFILFTDDCTRMTWLYLLKTKDEVPQIIKEFHKMVGGWTIQRPSDLKALKAFQPSLTSAL
jgi:hypothetical protein